MLVDMGVLGLIKYVGVGLGLFWGGAWFRLICIRLYCIGFLGKNGSWGYLVDGIMVKIGL